MQPRVGLFIALTLSRDLPTLIVKFMLRIDDALDLGAEHAMGGIIGLFFNGLFADKYLVALDGVTSVSGGWINHNYKQLYIQFAYICATVAYTFVVTALLAKALDTIPYFRLRASPEEEALGMDDTQVRSIPLLNLERSLTFFLWDAVQIGEFVSDYVEVRRDYRDWTPPSTRMQRKDSESTGSETPTAAGDRHGQPDVLLQRHGAPVVNGKPLQDGLEVISEKPAEEAA